MLKGLFKSGWKSDSVEKRLSYIADSDAQSTAEQSILENLVLNDADAKVRQAALAKIRNPQTLYDLSQGTDDNNNFGNALKNLFKSDVLSKDDCKIFLNKNPKSATFVAKYCQHETIRQEIISGLDEAQQADIIVDVAYSNTRILLAENLQQIETLEIARKNLKGKDKTAEKIVKAKIDAIYAQQKRNDENTALATSIREQMESLARYIHWSDEIRVKFFALSKSWDELDFEPVANENALYAEAFSKVKADVKNNLAITLSLQSQQEIVNKLETINAKLSAYSLDRLLLESSGISDELNDLNLQWKHETAVTPHTEEGNIRFLNASKILQSALKLSQSVSELRAIEKGDADKDLEQKAKAIISAAKKLPSSAFKSEAIETANTVLAASQQARKESKDSLDKLHKKINRLFATAKRGEVARANRELSSIVKGAENYDGFDRIKLNERIEEVTETVRKMGDWKDFAIEPKLIELCEKMEQLPELEKQSKHPSANNLAKKIKDLQDQWKKMGSSDISESYWPRFKEAGDKAYEPCAEFFEKRREIQQQNLENREPLIEQMKELFESTDWEGKPDYKSVEDTISQIMQSWKKIKDVDHRKGEKQWKKFSAIKDQVNEKLGIEYDKNIKAKHSLIELLEQIAEEDIDEKNNEQTLEKLKFQQNKWKQIGVTRRNEDQKAWVKFKAASDAVYNKIQDVRQEKRAVEDEQIDAYKNIHKQIHQLAKTTQDLSVTDKEFEDLKAQYDELPPLPSNLPEKLIERLGTDYNRACDAYANAKDRLNQAKLDNELETLAAKASLCAELEQLPVKTDPTVITALEDKINQLEINNKDYLKRFAKRLKKARETDREAFAEARRLLLIDCEILLDVESPKEDKDLRLQIQLDRMKEQGFGNMAINTTEQLKELKLEWICMPGAEAKVQQTFDKRFDSLFKT